MAEGMFKRYDHSVHQPMVGDPHWSLEEYEERKHEHGAHLAAFRYKAQSNSDLRVIRDLIAVIGNRDAEIARLKGGA